MRAATTTAFEVPPAIRLVGTLVQESDCWLEVGDTLAKADPEPVLFVL